jgi:hypothetical protein
VVHEGLVLDGTEVVDRGGVECAVGLDADIAEESGELLAQTEHFGGVLLADAAGSLSHLLFLQISSGRKGREIACEIECFCGKTRDF